MKRFLIMLLLFLAAGLFILSEQTFAAVDRDGGPNRSVRLTKSLQGVNRTLVNVGQVAMWIYSQGKSAVTPGGDSGLYFPRGHGTTTAAIYQDGFIWGGQVNDGGSPLVRVGGQTYDDGCVPGRIISAGQAEPFGDPAVDRVWRIRADYPTAELRQDAAELNEIEAKDVTEAQIAEVRAQYERDWIDWPAEKGAPFYDADGDGVYTPGFNADGTPKLRPKEGEEFDPAKHADEPGVAGADQVVWLVANDLHAGTVQTLYGSPSIGFELQVTLWAYRRADALGQIIFKQFRIIWKGTATTPSFATIDSTYFCQWSDPDVGSFGDDFVGCDTTLSMGYAYNSQTNDANYASVGLPPPASGYDFFAGPLVEDPDGVAIFGLKKRPGWRNLPMSSFAFFAAGQVDSDPTRGGDYNGTLQWWNLLRGFRPRPEFPPDPWKDPEGNRTYFRVPGDPVAGTGWIDENPGDRRLLLVAGPFTMALGDTQETVVAVMAALGSDRLSSVSVLKFVDRFAQEAFDNLFELPKPPPTPVVSATEFDGQILLNWGEDPEAVSAVEGSVERGFAFEGYNIYQLPTGGASLDQGIRLATFDVVNEVTVIAQETFDPTSGLILELPVQFGSNSGINRTITLDTDRIREAPLVNGQTYFFGITSYSFNPEVGLATKTLESPPAVLTVVPQTTKPGTRHTLTPGQTLEVTHVGESDGSVTANVIDPSKTVDANYEVTFTEAQTWNLVNTTTGDTLLADQTNQSGDADYLITDGLQVVVEGPPLVGTDWDYEGGRWISGSSGFGGELLFGGGFLGLNFWGESTVQPAEYHDIFMEWYAKESYTDLNGNGKYDIGEPYQLAAEDGQTANLYATWGGGNHSSVAKVPFRVWDTEYDPPRQLSVVVRDRDQNGQWDLHKLWDPADPDYVDVNGGDIRYNYIFILDSDYDETGDNWNPNAGGRDFMAEILENGGPVMWALWNVQRGSREPLGADFTLTMIAPNINLPSDIFSFTSTGPAFSKSTAEQDLRELVNVFPNPYNGFNSRELNRFNRYVTFSHLPQKAIIRIFTIAGALVRTIEKDDQSQFINWDLQNEEDLPVASGIYIAHIEFPDLGMSKDLKLAIIMEQQFLRNF